MYHLTCQREIRQPYLSFHSIHSLQEIVTAPGTGENALCGLAHGDKKELGRRKTEGQRSRGQVPFLCFSAPLLLYVTK